MSDQWHEQQPASVTPAPVDEAAFEEAPAWPKVVGTISVVWAAIGLTCAGCGVLGSVAPMVTPGMEAAFPDGFPPTLRNPPLIIWASHASGIVLAAYLCICGITLLLRKPIARAMFLVYGSVAILTALFGVYAGWVVQSEIAEWMQQNPNAKFSQQQQGGQAVQKLMIPLVLVIAFAWPVFCLIWFGAVKRDSQEIAKGVESLV